MSASAWPHHPAAPHPRPGNPATSSHPATDHPEDHPHPYPPDPGNHHPTPHRDGDDRGQHRGANPTPTGRHTRRWPLRRRRAGPMTGLLLGAAGSTFTTAIAAAVAGFQADRVLQPIEFTIRVSLLLAAPCLGAFLAAGFLPRFVIRPPAWTVGIGTITGPILVLRLDRIRAYGLGPTLATIAVIAAWAAISTIVAASARRPDPADRSELPPPTDPPTDTN